MKQLAHDVRDRHYAVDRTAAIVEATTDKIGAHDFTPLEAVCASQVLALDVIFNQYAREAAKWKTLSDPAVGMALKAQSQCRATLKTLVSVARALARRTPDCDPGEGGKKKSRNFDEQTNGNGNYGA